MTPHEFAVEIVMPTVQEFCDRRTSRRHAYLACIVTLALKDYLKKHGEVGVENRLRKRAGIAFELVRSICNASKHLETDDSHVIKFTAEQDSVRPAADWDVAKWDVSRFDDETGGLEISHHDKALDVFECLQSLLQAYQIEYPSRFQNVDLRLM